jgi:hypothetical protein
MHLSKNISIIKASGEPAPFLAEKLYLSLERAGADKETINYIIAEIEKSLYEGISTKKIYHKAFSMLKRKVYKPVAARYKLKQAILELGPSGFPFEIYISEIFKWLGYQVKIGQIIQGNCVKHEIDVIAEKENSSLLVECKFHGNQGFSCNVQIPLYIHARFMDIEKQMLKTNPEKTKASEGWLITNTKFTSDAIQYGTCAGLNLMGWDYPVKGSLREMIDNSALYPVTALSTLNSADKHKLLNLKIVLARDLPANEETLRMIGIHNQKLIDVLEECRNLCKGKNNG